MLFAIISYIPLSSVGVPENSPQSCYQRNCWPFSAFCRPWVPACVKKLPWFTCCALGFKVNPKTIWQNLLKALWIIHGLLVTDCTAADFTGNTLLITTGFFKHERVHSCKKQKTHHAHTHTNCPSPVVSFWRPSNPPRSSACRLQEWIVSLIVSECERKKLDDCGHLLELSVWAELKS